MGGELSAEKASELVGDDIEFWMRNPFLTAEMRTEKVVWWLSRTLAARAAGEAERTDAAVKAALADVEALAEKWNSTPDYRASDYDVGRADQRHDMTAELLTLLAEFAP